MSGSVTISNHMKKAVEQSVDIVSLRHMTARPQPPVLTMTTQHDLRVSNPKNVRFYLRRRCVTLRDAASTLRPMNRELEAMSKETSAV
jgi:hypothetical protein